MACQCDAVLEGGCFALYPHPTHLTSPHPTRPGPAPAQAVAVGLGAFSVAWSAGAAYWREAGATKAFASLGGGDFITLGSASGPDSDEEGAAAEGAEGEAPPPEIVVLFDGLPEDDEERQAACTWVGAASGLGLAQRAGVSSDGDHAPGSLRQQIRIVNGRGWR